MNKHLEKPAASGKFDHHEPVRTENVQPQGGELKPSAYRDGDLSPNHVKESNRG